MSMIKLAVLIGVSFLSADSMAAYCRKCRANILGRKPFCSRCMNDPSIKQMLKQEVELKKAKEKANAERQKKLNRKLGIESFLGFRFLSLSGNNDKQVVKPLQRPFRGYKDATLSYTSEKRLYKVEITDSVPNRTDTEIVAELTALSNVFEKKYNFKFESPLTGGKASYMTGGGTSISGGRVFRASREFVKLPWRTWVRSYDWQDFKLDMKGQIPANDNTDTNTHITVSITMKSVLNEDKEKTLKSATEDETGIDLL